MSKLPKLALTLAVATSGVAILDAIRVGITGKSTILGAESGMSLVILLAGLLHASAYVALALLLQVRRDGIDAGSKARRLLRICLEVSYLSMAVFFGPVVLGTWVTGADPADVPGLLNIPATLGFVGLFLFTITLGIALLKVPGMRLPALVLTGVLAGIVSPSCSPPCTPTTLTRPTPKPSPTSARRSRASDRLPVAATTAGAPENRPTIGNMRPKTGQPRQGSHCAAIDAVADRFVLLPPAGTPPVRRSCGSESRSQPQPPGDLFDVQGSARCAHDEVEGGGVRQRGCLPVQVEEDGGC